MPWKRKVVSVLTQLYLSRGYWAPFFVGRHRNFLIPISFREDESAQGHHLPSVPIRIETRTTTKRKAESGWQAVKIRKRRGTSSSRPSVTRRESPQWNWLQWLVLCQQDCERGRCHDIRGDQKSWFSPKAGTQAEERMLKGLQVLVGRIIRFVPAGVEFNPLAVPQLCQFLGCPQAESWQGRLGPQNEEICRKRIVPNDTGWTCSLLLGSYMPKWRDLEERDCSEWYRLNMFSLAG